jgi:hypothetical protein
MAMQAEARKGAELMNRGVAASGDISAPEPAKSHHGQPAAPRPSGNFTGAP